MSDPALAIQGAIHALLTDGSPPVVARVYDAVSPGAVFPYVTIGDDQVIGDDVECAEISEIFVRIHGWSRATGYPELKGIVASIRAALRSATFSLSGFTVEEVRFEQCQYLQDPDGTTRHAVIDYRFYITHG